MPEHVRKRFEDEQADGFAVYAENEKSVAVFIAMQSQWNIVSGGMGGAIWAGLRYEALDRPLRRMKVEPDEEDGVFDDVRIMEAIFMSERNRRTDG